MHRLVIDEMPVPGRVPSCDRFIALRHEVRAFLVQEAALGHFAPAPAGWDRHDEGFSRRLGRRGWIGMAWPKQFGGGERGLLERYVVAEELLAGGAPVWAHWLADRQVGPLILKFGTDAQKRCFLPRIAAGECFFCVGLSEPDAGSDLSAVRTRAMKVDGGWRITGAKVWTSYAHKSHFMNLFARTAPMDEQHRHTGFSQFLVDLATPGIEVRPILNMDRHHDLNEVVFDDAFVTDDALLGNAGDGWAQVTSELVNERSGPERWLNSYVLLKTLVEHCRTVGIAPDRLGALVARLWTLRAMSWSVAESLDRGEAPAQAAALVKDLGTTFDQTVPEVARLIAGETGRLGNEDRGLAEALDRIVLYAPSFSLRGGAPEILRGIIARGLGLR